MLYRNRISGLRIGLVQAVCEEEHQRDERCNFKTIYLLKKGKKTTQTPKPQSTFDPEKRIKSTSQISTEKLKKWLEIGVPSPSSSQIEPV